MIPGTSVVYLVRINEGLAPVQRFLASYLRYDAGVPHRFLVLRRGFALPGAWDAYEAVFDEFGAAHDSLDVAETGFDLGAYREAAQKSSADVFCFLNTFSEVLCDGWLANLHRASQLDRAGLVGATGSWESWYSSGVPARRPAATRLPRRATAREWFRARALRRDFAAFPNPHVRTNAFMVTRTLALGLDWGPLHTKADA